jgi:U3 small nucleolar RNA-associated protein 11
MTKPQSKLHRERSQPANRAKFGLLEKHKDYQKRAADYHRKERRLKALNIRAAYRNPDEFYFGMIRSRLADSGVHRAKDVGQLSLPHDVVHLLKTQDLSYVQRQRVANDRCLRDLREQVIPQAAVSSHIVFESDAENEGSLIVHEKVLVPSEHDKPDADSNEDDCADKDKSTGVQRQIKGREERARKLRQAEHELQGHYDRMGRLPFRKLVDLDGHASYRWLSQREK